MNNTQVVSSLRQKLCPKVQHILQVWEAGLGVISLHCFQNVIPVEAYTREASMVEAVGKYEEWEPHQYLYLNWQSVM